MDRIHITLPTELLAKIDQKRGDVPRAKWINRAIERALAKAEAERKAKPNAD